MDEIREETRKEIEKLSTRSAKSEMISLDRRFIWIQTVIIGGLLLLTAFTIGHLVYRLETTPRDVLRRVDERLAKTPQDVLDRIDQRLEKTPQDVLAKVRELDDKVEEINKAVNDLKRKLGNDKKDDP